jgi:hypothetical protein
MQRSNIKKLTKNKQSNFIFIKIKLKKLNQLIKEEENSNIEIEIVNDFDMTPGTRRPKIIMQTCAHISGAAFYYNKKLIEEIEVNNNVLKVDKKLVFIFQYFFQLFKKEFLIDSIDVESPI